VQWFVYIVQGSRGALYCGISTDPDRRVGEHNNSSRGARALRGQRPVTLVWTHPHALDKSEALKLEARIKLLSRVDKKLLINGWTPAAWADE
jgi:putative endonuclease